MNNQVLLLIVIVVVVALCTMYPSTFGITKEGFDKKVVSETHNPKMYQPDLNDEIKHSEIIGLPNDFLPAWEGDSMQYSDFYEVNDGANGNMSMGFNMCSKSCCSQQYPPPFGLPADPLVCNSKQEFVPSSYTCNNGWQDGGCLCMTKDQALFLNTRGNNS